MLELSRQLREDYATLPGKEKLAAELQKLYEALLDAKANEIRTIVNAHADAKNLSKPLILLKQRATS